MAITAFKSVKNNARSSLVATLASGTGNTTFSVTSGTGTRFPAPATDGPFWATIWSSALYADPFDDPNMEIVLVTARSTDAFTCTRAQQGTGSPSHSAGNAVRLLMTAPNLTDAYTAINLLERIQRDGVLTGGMPVGSVNLTTSIPQYQSIITNSSGIANIVTSAAAGNRTFTASKMTYCDQDSTGALVYTETTIGAAEPALAANSIRLWRGISSGTAILAFEDLRWNAKGQTVLHRTNNVGVGITGTTQQDLHAFTLQGVPPGEVFITVNYTVRVNGSNANIILTDGNNAGLMDGFSPAGAGPYGMTRGVHSGVDADYVANRNAHRTFYGMIKQFAGGALTVKIRGSSEAAGNTVTIADGSGDNRWGTQLALVVW